MRQYFLTYLFVQNGRLSKLFEPLFPDFINMANKNNIKILLETYCLFIAIIQFFTEKRIGFSVLKIIGFCQVKLSNIHKMRYLKLFF